MATKIVKDRFDNAKTWNLGVMMHRNNALPFDKECFFFSYEDAYNYATGSPISYVGQTLAVHESGETEETVKYYIIDENSQLRELGEPTLWENEIPKTKVNFDRTYSHEDVINPMTSDKDTVYFTSVTGDSKENRTIIVDGKEYGREIPIEYHKLPYTEDVDGVQGRKAIVPKGFMYENWFVVDNQEDFEKCKGSIEYGEKKYGMWDVINDWKKIYTDNTDTINPNNWVYNEKYDTIDASNNDDYGNAWINLDNKKEFVQNISEFGYYERRNTNDGIGTIIARIWKDEDNIEYIDKITLDCGNRVKLGDKISCSLSISRTKRNKQKGNGTTIKSLSISTSEKRFIYDPTTSGYTALMPGSKIVPIIASSHNQTYFVKVETIINNGIITYEFSNPYLTDVGTGKEPIIPNRKITIDLKNYLLNIINEDGLDVTYDISKTPKEYDSNGKYIRSYASTLDHENNVVSQWNEGVDFTDVLDSLAEELHYGFYQSSTPKGRVYNNYYVDGNNVIYNNIILDIEKNEVWQYTGSWEKIDKVPLDLFYGSHQSYNSITKKLWYSNGERIYQIATNDITSSGGGSITPEKSNDIIYFIEPTYWNGDIIPVPVNIGDTKFELTSSPTGYTLSEYKTTKTGNEWVEINNENVCKLYSSYTTNDEYYTFDTDYYISTTPVEDKLYISKTNNIMYYWNSNLNKFIPYNRDNIYNSVKFYKADFVISGGTQPEASENQYKYMLLTAETGNDKYEMYHSEYNKLDDTWEWNKIENEEEGLLSIYFEESIGPSGETIVTEKVFITDEDGYFTPQDSYTFYKNIYYINQYSGDIYEWNGVNLVLLTDTEINLENNITISYDTTHTKIRRKARIESQVGVIGAIIDYRQKSSFLSNVNIYFDSYKTSKNGTIIATNIETNNTMSFKYEVIKRDNVITQNIYHNLGYFTRTYDNVKNTWKSWKCIFNNIKENITFTLRNNHDSSFRSGFKINVHEQENILLCEEFITFNFYRYSRSKKRRTYKWRVINDKHRYSLFRCLRDKNSSWYYVGVRNSEKPNVGNYLKLCFLDDLFDECLNYRSTDYPNGLNDIMKYGCNTNFFSKVVVISGSHYNLSTYGYEEGYHYNVVNSDYSWGAPCLTLLLGCAVSFGGVQNTDIKQIKLKLTVNIDNDNIITISEKITKYHKNYDI